MAIGICVLHHRPPFSFSLLRHHRNAAVTTPTRLILFNTPRYPTIKIFSAQSPVHPLTQDDLKKLATDKAVEYVRSGMVLGLGTSSTAASLGIPLSVLDDHPKLDLEIDDADEDDPDLNLLKGRGSALLREKMVEAASKKFVVVVDDSKLVSGLGGSGLAMTVEVVQFCRKYNLIRLQELFAGEGCDAKLRLDDDGKPYVTDNMNYIVDLYFKTPIKDAWAAGKEISAFEGVVEHWLFLDMATTVIITRKDGVSVKNK